MLVQTPIFYDITHNPFRQILFRSPITLLLLELTLLFLSVPLFHPITKLVISFPEPTSQNPSVLSSDSHLLNIDLNTDQYSTPPKPNRVDYPLTVNDTLVNSHHQDSRFLYLATNKLNSNTNFSNQRRRKEFQRLDPTNLEIKCEITAKFHNLSPHPIPSL